MEELTCEACGKAPAADRDILCSECGRSYFILMDLLRRHPEMGKDDLTRVIELMEWRNQREAAWMQGLSNRAVKPPSPNPDQNTTQGLKVLRSNLRIT